jgi:Fur family iron response transcriptional regulator
MTAHFDPRMFKNNRQKIMQKRDSSTTIDFAEQLRLSGLRPTRQRISIAALLLDGRHRHVSADSLTEEIIAAGIEVSVGTVYNTLNQFTSAGLLRRVLVHNDYSLFDTNTDHHHHFYEASSDQLVDIPNDDVSLAKLPQAPDGHEIKAVDVVIHIQSK